MAQPEKQQPRLRSLVISIPKRQRRGANVQAAVENLNWWERLRGRLSALLGAEPRELAAMRFYTRLAVQLKLEHTAGQRAKCILLTTPTSDELIRDTGVEFANVLANEMGQRVLLIDVSLETNGESRRPGVTNLLVNGVGCIGDLARPTDNELVFSLPPGSGSLAPASFGSGRHAELIERACNEYDTVILLSAPLLKNPRWLVFAPLVDHSLLLATEGRTYVENLEASLQALAECNAAGVGVVLNRGGRARR